MKSVFWSIAGAIVFIILAGICSTIHLSAMVFACSMAATVLLSVAIMCYLEG